MCSLFNLLSLHALSARLAEKVNRVPMFTRAHTAKPHFNEYPRGAVHSAYEACTCQRMRVNVCDRYLIILQICNALFRANEAQAHTHTRMRYAHVYLRTVFPLIPNNCGGTPLAFACACAYTGTYGGRLQPS